MPLEMFLLDRDINLYDQVQEIAQCDLRTIEYYHRIEGSQGNSDFQWAAVKSGDNFRLLIYAPLGVYTARYECVAATHSIELNWTDAQFRQNGEPLDPEDIAGVTIAMTLDYGVNALTVVGTDSACFSAWTEEGGVTSDTICVGDAAPR
jgi:hypothetical protein